MNNMRCPICARVMKGAREAWLQLPFCSQRCQLIDLGRWLGEGYGLPVDSDTEHTAEDQPDSP